MPPNAFINQPHPPDADQLAGALGASHAVWETLLAQLAREHGADVSTWKSYAPKWGWSLRVLRKKRTIVWLSPGRGSFEVLYILGEKAVAAAGASDLPDTVRQALSTAPRYPEGTGLRLLVKSPRQLTALTRLAAIKLAH